MFDYKIVNYSIPDYAFFVRLRTSQVVQTLKKKLRKVQKKFFCGITYQLKKNKLTFTFIYFQIGLLFKSDVVFYLLFEKLSKNISNRKGLGISFVF